jgi:hypothetical protein
LNSERQGCGLKARQAGVEETLMTLKHGRDDKNQVDGAAEEVAPTRHLCGTGTFTAPLRDLTSGLSDGCQAAASKLPHVHMCHRVQTRTFQVCHLLQSITIKCLGGY